MARFLLLLCALAIGGIATLIYLDTANFDTRTAKAMQNDGLAAITAPAETIFAAQDNNGRKQIFPPPQDGNIAAITTGITKKMTARKVARWIEETEDDDPAVRANAIDALSSAPKTKALPALLNVMRAGGDNDRQLALDSLHTIALQQGDDNDEIRTALRLVIYDGEEGAMISNAQIALEDIEYDLTPPAPTAMPHARIDR